MEVSRRGETKLIMYWAFLKNEPIRDSIWGVFVHIAHIVTSYRGGFEELYRIGKHWDFQVYTTCGVEPDGV